MQELDRYSIHVRPLMLCNELLDRGEHQRERRSKFVADVAEERGLREVQLCQRLGAFFLFLVSSGTAHALRNTCCQQSVESRVRFAAPEQGAEPQDDESERRAPARALDAQDGRTP